MQAIHEAQAKQIAELMKACEAIIDSIGEQTELAVTSETTYQVNAHSICDMGTALAALQKSLKIGIANSSRPSAIIRVCNPDDTYKDYPLDRDCYWVGRKPQPDDRVAGAIVLQDPNPKAPITSRFHCELKVIDGRWFVLNHSENGIVIYPRSPSDPSGMLRHNSKIFVGHSCLIYKEIQREIIGSDDEEHHPTCGQE